MTAIFGTQAEARAMWTAQRKAKGEAWGPAAWAEFLYRRWRECEIVILQAAELNMKRRTGEARKADRPSEPLRGPAGAPSAREAEQ